MIFSDLLLSLVILTQDFQLIKLIFQTMIVKISKGDETTKLIRLCEYDQFCREGNEQNKDRLIYPPFHRNIMC